MRLLDTRTGQFIDKNPERTRYAILSHAWHKHGEQTYEKLRDIQWRYTAGQQTPQRSPSADSSSSESSPEQDSAWVEPSPTPPLSLTPSPVSLTPPPLLTPPRTALTPPHSLIAPSRDSLSAITPPSTPSKHSKSRIIGRITQLKARHQHYPTPGTPRVQIVTDASSHPPGNVCSNYTAAPATSNPSLLNLHDKSHLLLQLIWDDPELSHKIRDACRIAREGGYDYIWIDSCCIDKSSSSELSEAINSMYEWYRRADVCYVYLADVPTGDDHHAEGSAFRKSRWFTRGWTLQELIAPGRVEFLSKDWDPIGSKQALVDLVRSITKINYKALLQLVPLDEFSVAQRFSWAANRKTTRKEDRAYSPLGIFNIHMPTLYGEGDHAFRRLQELIMQRIPDQSLFAWGEFYPGTHLSPNPDTPGLPIAKPSHADAQRYNHRYLFAASPDSFQNCGDICITRRDTTPLSSSHYHQIQYTSTPYGICTQFQMIPLTRDLLQMCTMPHSNPEYVQLKFPDALASKDYNQWYFAILGCNHTQYPRHLLGRVCYLSPSEPSIDLMHPGYIRVESPGNHQRWAWPDLFPLSHDSIERCRPCTTLKTVYIPHADRDNLLLASLQSQPYTAIKLVLLTEARDALRYRGYSADLRDPDPYHPTAHRLTLSKPEGGHTITVTFRHSLRNDGRGFTMDAEIKMLAAGSRIPLDSAHHLVSWKDHSWLKGWETNLHHRRVQLNAGRAMTLDVDLALSFAGTGVYILSVDILSGPPLASESSAANSSAVKSLAVESSAVASSAVELAVDLVHSPSGPTEMERGVDLEEAGGHDMARAGNEDREKLAVRTSESTADEDDYRAWAQWVASELLKIA